MFDKLTVPSLGLIMLLLVSAALGQQTPATPAGQPAALGLITLTGADAQRAADLDKAIEAARKADHWDEATSRAEDLLALRTRVQGPAHFETVNVAWLLKALRRVAPMPKEDRVAYQSANTLQGQADNLVAQGKYSQAQPLYEKVLEIRRRLLTDDHPDTARGYNDLAFFLNAQGKYAAAQPLFGKALEFRRRLLGDDHPQTAQAYNNLAANLAAQGQYAAAQPLLEKALEIYRRMLTDDHPDTAEVTVTWRTTSTRRGSSRRPSRCARRCWRSSADC
jgi:tetratricopeptide (TPR) repeat protein